MWPYDLPFVKFTRVLFQLFVLSCILNWIPTAAQTTLQNFSEMFYVRAATSMRLCSDTSNCINVYLWHVIFYGTLCTIRKYTYINIHTYHVCGLYMHIEFIRV